MRTFTLGSGADTVVFDSVASANGVDTITNFTAGDKLNFKAFSSGLTVAAGDLTVTSTAKKALTDNNKIYQTTIDGAIKSKDYGNTANFDELFHSTNNTPFSTTTTNQNKEVIVVKGNDVTQIYYVSATAATLTDAMVDLVAVIDNNGSGVTLAEANFVLA